MIMMLKAGFTITLLLLTMLILGCGASENHSASNNVSNIATQPISIASITSSEAQKHIGSNKTVCGNIVDSRYASTSTGKPTFLNYDYPYPKHSFTVVIWGDKRASFAGKPEKTYLNQTVCATGLIESYKGKPQIIARESSQLTIKR